MSANGGLDLRRVIVPRLQALRCEPATNARCLQVRIQTLAEVLIPAREAEEARVPQERGGTLANALNVGDDLVREATASKKGLRDSSLRRHDSVQTDG